MSRSNGQKDRNDMEVQLPLWVMVAGALSGAIGAVSGLVAIIRQWRRDRWEGQHAGKRTDAEVTASLTTTAINLINELQERVDKLHERVKHLEDEREHLKCRITCLEDENKELRVELALLREVVRERDERIGELESENRTLQDEVTRLEARVGELESKNGGKHG